ncbi:MAG: type IV pilus twitching motility protein PilT [Candidatus Omnitrophica bacterium]|nr:type IV pilus twitching motility protein PilT [Candidatus Omnitrophota bacterium]
MNIENLLKRMAEIDASDLHLKAGRKPFFRIKTILQEVSDYPVLTAQEIEQYAFSIMNEKQRTQFIENMEMDLATESPETGRFRVNIFRQRGNIGIVMRRIKSSIPSFEQLGLPAVLEKICDFPTGLVLVAGPTGCGKSTTLAAMIEYINTSKQALHIITIEDPIEYVYTDKNCLINQREVGIDTLSFHDALKRVLREDPDIILIGELRDTETFEAAIRACETGHLVFSTLHTVDTVTTINRILDFFPQNQHEMIRKILAYNLRATCCQKLLPKKDGTGMVPACEIMIVTPIVSRLIIEDKIGKIPSAIAADKEAGMQTFNQHLVKLINEGKITKETGFEASPAPHTLEMNLRGIYLDEETRIIGE